MYYAVAEGLAGIEDRGRAFDRVTIAPRWAASQATQAGITLHYPASDGYCCYTYKLDRAQKRITLDVTGSFRDARIHCLLPKGAKAKRVVVAGAGVAFKNTRVEQSAYVDFSSAGLPCGPIVIWY